MIFWLRLDDGKQRSIGAMIRKHLCIPCSGALDPRSDRYVRLKPSPARVVRIWGQVVHSLISKPLGHFRMILNYKKIKIKKSSKHQAPSNKLDSGPGIL